MDTREQIQAAIRENPNQMTMLLARQFGVPEVEVVRAFPDDRAVELDAQRWEELIRRLETFDKVHVLVSNGGATLEANGEFGGFSTTGDFFNVQTKSLDMHIQKMVSEHCLVLIMLSSNAKQVTRRWPLKRTKPKNYFFRFACLL